jgi:hypothetical protein
VCTIIITHKALHAVYKKYGVHSYTLVYCTAVGITTSWIVSYKIISSVLVIAALCAVTISLLSTQHYVPAPAVIPHKENNNWIETIMSLSIQAFHEAISLTWIIDYEERLHELLYTELQLQLYLTPKVSTIIFNTLNPTTKTSVLWINKHGYIIGINPCKGTTQETPTLSDITLWSKQKGVIVIQSYAQKRTYTVVHNGMTRDNLSSHHAFHMIKQILTPNSVIPTQELV